MANTAAGLTRRSKRTKCARGMPYSLTGPTVQDVKTGGTHGALNDLPELRSAFLVVGPGVPTGKKFELIDMRNIAPTLAGLVGLKMPSADGKSFCSEEVVVGAAF